MSLARDAERLSSREWWINDLSSKGVPEVASCSITELGFIRVLAQASQYVVVLVSTA